LSPLGEYKIKIIDLLSHIVPYFKNISKLLDKILIDNEFFPNAFNYLYEYEWNNIYQESLLSLLKSIINDADNHELIQDYLFNKLNIIEVIKTHTNSEDKYKFNDNLSNPISHGYYSFFISLSYKINTALGGTPVVLENNTKARQGSFSFMVKPPENSMSLLFGNFCEDDNNENEAEKEEEKYNYESMKKYINDDWRLLFGNISEVIKQYEKRDWPKEDEKKDEESPFGGLPGQKEEEDNLPENNGKSDEEKNIMKGDDNNVNGNENDASKKEVGEQGNNNNGENPSSKDVNIDSKDSGDNNNEKKEEDKQKENELKNEGEVQGKETDNNKAKSEDKPGDTKVDEKKEEKKDGEKIEENKDGDNKKESEKNK
jgi:hypothetical protein